MLEGLGARMHRLVRGGRFVKRESLKVLPFAVFFLVSHAWP